MTATKKHIVVECCDECPHHGNCKAWLKLSGQDKVFLTIGVGVGRFILKGCHLDDYNESKPTISHLESTIDPE